LERATSVALFFCVEVEVDNGEVKSWVEISGERLVENLRAVQAIVNEHGGAETLGVVKANAYGHDAAIVAPLLVNAGVKWLGVADVEEGIRVRGRGAGFGDVRAGRG
jgi:alanine racemase